MYGYIYKITNPSGKIYIGKTSNIENRKKFYARLLCKTQPKLFNSIKEYGWSTHVFETIEQISNTDINEKLFRNRERFWINHYNSTIDGLNSIRGGGGKNTKVKKQNITFTVDDKLYETFSELADRLAINKSKFVENRIKDFVKQHS